MVVIQIKFLLAKYILQFLCYNLTIKLGGEKMATITLQNIYDCYDYGKRIANEEIDIGGATLKLSKTGMNSDSAKIYLRCVRSLIKGERYTGTVNELALSHFLTAITTDFGFAGLAIALSSVKMHLEYQNRYQNLVNIKRIYDEFIEILP